MFNKIKNYFVEHFCEIILLILAGLETLFLIKDNIVITDKENYKYSDKFFRDASDEELNTERERVRLKTISCYDNTFDTYNRLLIKFDKVINDRANKKNREENPNGSLPRHQHGWYLPEDDD